MQTAASPADLLKLMALAHHTNRTRFRRTVLQPMIDADLIETTIPDKPRSSKQRYRLTELGRKIDQLQTKAPQSETLYRILKELYTPEEAMREAVVNVLAHRDYRSTANVQVYIFKDRVEIVNPGGLPAGMTEADLGTKSIPRNPLLFGHQAHPEPLPGIWGCRTPYRSL